MENPRESLKSTTQEGKWYHYCLFALADVEANFLVVKANQYTSITSVMLLDCWAIPCGLVLTFVFLKTKYSSMKITGVALCILGVVMVVFSNVHRRESRRGSFWYWHDVSLIFAHSVYHCLLLFSTDSLLLLANTVELMTFGFLGAIISAIQICIFERGELKAVEWSAENPLPFLRFAVSMFLSYSLLPTSGSAMFTLSLLTSDMWAVLIRIFAYHEKTFFFNYLFYNDGFIENNNQYVFAFFVDILLKKEKDEEDQKDEQRMMLDQEDGETLGVSYVSFMNLMMACSLLGRSVFQLIKVCFADASKTGVAQEAMQNAVRKAGKAINEQEARQILGVTEQTSWEEILQKYDKLFENNAKAGSFYLQSKVLRAKECLEVVYRSNGTPS
ncbi:hypothetical protein Bca101_037585 [Brassica carinata]